MVIKTAAVKQKKKRKAGFTLVEMLAAIVVLILMCAGVWSGLSVVSGIYRDMLFQSNSQILEDTIDTEFTNVLRHAGVKTEGDDIHLTTDRNLGLSAGGSISLDARSSDKEAEVFYAVPDDEDESSRQYLVNPGAYLDMSITDYTLTYSSEDKVFTGHYTIVSRDKSREKECEFKCTNLMQ